MLLKLNKILVVVLTITSLSGSFAQNLKVVTLNSILPAGRYHIPTVYDGEDSIYLLGGDQDGSISTQLFKFSITTHIPEQVGWISSQIGLGSGIWVGNETMYYLCSFRPSRIWKISTLDFDNMPIMYNFTAERDLVSSIWDPAEQNAYIIGGRRSLSALSMISRFSAESNTVEDVAELPSARHSTSAVWDEANGNAFVFGGVTGISTGYLNDIIKYNPATNTVSKLNVALPIHVGKTCAIWTGKEAYIIGGTTNLATTWPSIVRFNPSTNQVEEVPVDNFPDKLYATGCAYVEKLNRIYLFGGRSGGAYSRQMSYIDLDNNVEPTSTTPDVPTTTITTTGSPIIPSPVDCRDEQDGTLHANPFCCESFYQCDNRVAVLHQCPDFLQFSPISDRCERPDLVRCGIFYQN